MSTYTQIACMLVQGCVEIRPAQLLPELPHDAGKDDEGMGGSLGSKTDK